MKVQTDSDRYLQKLEEQKKDRIAIRESQIDQIDDVYDRRMKEVQEKGDVEIDKEKINKQQELLETISAGEEKLKDYKNDVEHTMALLENSRQNSIGYHREQAKRITDNYGEKIGELQEKVTRNTQNNNEEANRAVEKSSYQTKEKMRGAQIEGEKRVNALITGHEKKYKNEDINYRTIRQNAELQFYKEMAKNKFDRERVLKEQSEKTANQATILDTAHEKRIQDLEANYDKLFVQREALFQDRFKLQQANNDSYYNRLKQQFAKDIQNLTAEHMKKKDAITSQAQDDFYHVKSLSPVVTEGDKFYLISFPVPEHEKESVILNAFDRTIRLSLSRRFDDSYTNDLGEKDTSKRSELITREFNVKDILNPKKITQNYEDGMLTFKVAKK